MKKKIYYILAVIAFLWIGMNIFLLLKDDSKADRTVYIHDWTRISSGDIAETFETEGVAFPGEEQGVYFDAKKGNMASFYVEQGDAITEDTPLFSYDTSELEQQKADVEIEIDRLMERLDSIEEQIDELLDIDVSSPSTDAKEAVVLDLTPLVEGNIEQAVVEAEAEKRKLEADIEAREEKLDQISDRIDDVTVFSETGGYVMAVNKDLQAPAIVIVSETLSIEGVLSEEQMKKAEVGQEVNIYSELHEQYYSGIITKINPIPIETPSIGTEPIYSFVVSLDEEEDDSENMETEEVSDVSVSEEEAQLLIGSGVKMKVLVKEALNVPVIASKSVDSSPGQKNIYKLTADGTVERYDVTIGIAFEGKSEITSGVELDEVIVSNPEIVSVNGSGFITPMRATGLQTEEMKNMPKKQIVKYILMGLVEN